MDAKAFLKKYSTIPNSFIDELFKMYDENTLSTDLVIDLDAVSAWLSIAKYNLLAILKKNYKPNIDYKITKKKNPNQKDPRNNNYKHVLLTTDCFKRLCMQSRSKKSEDVRTYFIEVEKLVFKYKNYLVEGLEKRIQQLERNQRPKNYEPSSGFVYVIKASNTKDSVYKIGRTKDLKQRLSSYNSGQTDDVEVVFVYETEDIKAVESCAKSIMRSKQYRKYKEVYQADVDMIKEVIAGCDNLKKHFEARTTKLEGGYYLAITS